MISDRGRLRDGEIESPMRPSPDGSDASLLGLSRLGRGLFSGGPPAFLATMAELVDERIPDLRRRIRRAPSPSGSRPRTLPHWA